MNEIIWSLSVSKVCLKFTLFLSITEHNKTSYAPKINAGVTAHKPVE